MAIRVLRKTIKINKKTVQVIVLVDYLEFVVRTAYSYLWGILIKNNNLKVNVFNGNKTEAEHFLYEINSEYITRQMAANLIGITFQVAKEEIQYIKSDALSIELQVAEIRGIAECKVYDSSDTKALITLSPNKIIYDFFTSYFGGFEKIKLIMEEEPLVFQKSQRLQSIFDKKLEGITSYGSIKHEFEHYLDRQRHLIDFKKRERLRNLLQDENDDFISSAHYLSAIRTEGLAVFTEFKNYRFFDYKRDELLIFRLILSTYQGKDQIIHHSKETFYYLGMFMCYIIGLAFYYENYRKNFDEMKGLIDEGRYVFFGQGMNNIFDSKEIKKIENLPEQVIEHTRVAIRNWGEFEFLRHYERACSVLKISKKYIIFTLKDYNRMKKIEYKRWLKKTKKK